MKKTYAREKLGKLFAVKIRILRVSDCKGFDKFCSHYVGRQRTKFNTKSTPANQRGTREWRGCSAEAENQKYIHRVFPEAAQGIPSTFLQVVKFMLV